MVLFRIGLVGRVFANGPGDLGSIPHRVIPKTLKMVLDTSLLNTQQYKACIKGKVKQSREKSCTFPNNLVVVAIEKGAFWSPSTMVASFTFTYINTHTQTCIDLRLTVMLSIVISILSTLMYLRFWF